MTFDEILSYVRMYAKDLDGKKYPRALILALANEGQLNMAERTRCMQSVMTTNSVADQREYDLPNIFIDIDFNGGLSFDGKRLVQVTLNWLDDYAEGWRDEDSATPVRYYLRRNTLGLQPKPSAVKQIKLYYFKKPDAMTLGTDYPFNADRRFDTAHEGIVFYVLMRIAMMDANPDMLAIYTPLYNNELAQLEGIVNNKEDLRQGFVPSVNVSAFKL